VIVGAEAFSYTEITEASRRGHAMGVLSVDLSVDPAIDHKRHDAAAKSRTIAQWYSRRSSRRQYSKRGQS
jgi:hypothetical protein